MATARIHLVRRYVAFSTGERSRICLKVSTTPVRLVIALLVALSGCGFGPKPDLPAPQSATEMRVGSTVEDGGDLTIDFDFATNGTARLTPSSSLGSAVLYSAIDPSFDLLLASVPKRSVYVLPAGVEVSVELLEADEGASLKVETTLLNEPGEVAVLGSEPGAHVHPEWRIVWPLGQVPPDRRISFRVFTAGGEFAPSADYSVVLTASGTGSP